jgi:hypothetical protein
MPLLFHQHVAHALAAKRRPHLFYERAKFLGASLTCTWYWSTTVVQNRKKEWIGLVIILVISELQEMGQKETIHPSQRNK